MGKGVVSDWKLSVEFEEISFILEVVTSKLVCLTIKLLLVARDNLSIEVSNIPFGCLFPISYWMNDNRECQSSLPYNHAILISRLIEQT